MQAPGLASGWVSGTVCQGHRDAASEPLGCWTGGTAPSLPQRRQQTHGRGLTIEPTRVWEVQTSPSYGPDNGLST